MRPRARDAALRGVTAALAFLVLAQAYRLVTDTGPNTLVLVAAAVPVALVTSGLAYALRGRLAAAKRRV